MRSIRRQLTVSLLLALTLILGGGGAAVFLAVRDSLMDQFDDSLRVKALTIIGYADQRKGEVNVKFSDRFLREFDDDVATDFFQVFQLDGRGRSAERAEERSEERSDSLHDHELPMRHGTLKKPLFWNLKLPDDAPGRAVGIRFTPRGGHRDDRVDAIVVVAAKRSELDATLAELRMIFLAAGGALLGLTALVVALVLPRGLRPLAHVADQATKIDANSLKTRFPVQNLPAELHPICERLNDLLSRLEESFERERRFSSDLAHELRTPLAELRAQAEVALRWPGEAQEDAHQQTLEIAVQMEALVARLLAMGRAEQGQIPVEFAPVAVAPLIEDALKRQASRIAEQGLQVEVTVPEDAIVDSDPVLLRAIVSNLVDNAAQYAPSGTRVAIRYAGKQRAFTIEVENEARQLTPEDVPRLFDRFWRKDSARTEAENSGLGLSLARSFAYALGAELTARLQGGSRLVLNLSAPG